MPPQAGRPGRDSAHRTAAPSDEAGAAGLARAFRRKCDGLLPRGCCAEELRSAVWQLLSYVLARSFAGSLAGPQLCAAIASGFSNDPNVDDATRTPTRCATQDDHILTETEWTGRYGPKPGPRRYGRHEERVRQLLLSPAACGVLASLAFDRMGASETLGEVAHVLFALLSACITFGLPAMSAALARDVEHGNLVRCWGLSCPVGATPKGIGGVVGLLALRGAEAMTALLHYGRNLDGSSSSSSSSSSSAGIPSFGQLAPLSETAWRRISQTEQWHLAPRPLLVQHGSSRLSFDETDRVNCGNAAERNSLPWALWRDTPKRIFEELLAQASGFAEPGVRWSKMSQDLMEEDGGSATLRSADKTFEYAEEIPGWQPRRGYFSKVTLDSVGGRHCMVQLFVCPLRRDASSLESSCELTAEAIAACRHSDGQTYRMLLPRQLAMSWVEAAMSADGSSVTQNVLDPQAPGQHVLCDEPKAHVEYIDTAEGASGFVKMSSRLPASPSQNLKPSVKCCIEMLAGVLFVDAPREPTVDYGAWNQWNRREKEAAAIRSKLASELPRSRSHLATQMTTMTHMVDADDDVRAREAALDGRRKQRVDAFKSRLDDLVDETMDLTDDWNETEEDEELRRARLRSERAGFQPLEREPEGVHRYAKVTVRCSGVWSDVSTGSAVQVEVSYKTRHASAWPDDHYLTQRGRLRFTLTPPAPGTHACEGTTELQDIKVPLVYNQEVLMDDSAAASDPLHFKVMIESAKAVSIRDDAEARVGAQCTTVYLTSPLQPRPNVVEPRAEDSKTRNYVLEHWTPFKVSVSFCRTCGRIASDANCTAIWAECLHAHGLPQRLGQQPGVCQEMSAASELAAAFAVRRLRTMDTARAPRRRTMTVAQRKEYHAARETEEKRTRQNRNPLKWLDKLNEAARVSELERVLTMIAKNRKLPWAGAAYSGSVWQQLALGRRDALFFLDVTIRRMAEDSVLYEPPEQYVDRAGDKSNTDTGSLVGASRHAHKDNQPKPASALLASEQKPTKNTTEPPRDLERASWEEFRRSVRNYAKVSANELSDDQLRDVYATAADKDGKIERSEIAQMLAMSEASTALARTQRLPEHLDSSECTDAFAPHNELDPPGGKESLDRLDAASRQLNLRYAFHVGALTHREYSAAMERLDNIQDQLDQDSLIDHRLLSPEILCSAESKAETALPGVLSRLPGIAKVTRVESSKNDIRNLVEEWKQEMFDLTARKCWKPDPRLGVEKLGVALVHSGGNCDTRGWNGQTVLMSCAKVNFVEGALFLLHKGANRLLQNNRGWSALMLAAKHGHAEMCVALLTAAIPVEKLNRTQGGTRQHMLQQTNSSGDTALDIAVVNDMGACADLLAAYGAVVPLSLKDVATRQAGSGGWFHLAAASAAAGDISTEATTDAKDIEEMVQQSSLAALTEGRAMQLARQTELGRKLYGTKQPSGKILPAVAEQGWGPSMSEKVADKARAKIRERDAEWVEMSGAMAPRAMHRMIAFDKRIGTLWRTTSKASRPEQQGATKMKSSLQPAEDRSKKQAIENTSSHHRGGGRQLPTEAASSVESAPVGDHIDNPEQTCEAENALAGEASDHNLVDTASSDTKKVKIPSLREQLQNRKLLHDNAFLQPAEVTTSTQEPIRFSRRHEAQTRRTRGRVRVPSMREQMAALAR